MSLEQVKKFFEDKGRNVIELEQSSATVELAAKALKVAPERIAKTLAFKLDEGVVLIVTAGDMKIDNAKYRNYFHTKAKMLSADDVFLATGHKIGGVCPFALPQPKPKVYLDISLKRFESVFPACGSANSAIELTPNELFNFSDASEWIDVCRSKTA